MLGSSVHVAFALLHASVVLALLRHPRGIGARIALVVASLLVVDNAVLAAGASIGEGETLRTLNLVRFAGHAIVTPLLVVAVRAVASSNGVSWVRGRSVRIATWLLAAGLVAFGLVTDLRGLDLVPIAEGGILRYHDPTGGPPLAAIVTILVVIVLAVGIGRARGGWATLVGSVTMLVASALDPLAEGPAVGNAGEVALMLGIAATMRRVGDVRGRSPRQ